MNVLEKVIKSVHTSIVVTRENDSNCVDGRVENICIMKTGRKEPHALESEQKDIFF